MPVYRIDLAYDGSRFRGWARNAGVRTVQAEIEGALARIVGEEVALSVAGRTDAGVHARHQVASFPCAALLDEAAVLRSLRTMLGPEVAFASLQRGGDDFDARFSARRRSYRYFIDEALSHDPLRAHWVWHRGETLDAESMNQAAAAFVGPHDFASLCRAAEGGTTERTVASAFWERATSFHLPASSPMEVISHQLSVVTGLPAPASGLLVFSVSAKAFCHQMVRSMVALCVEEGRGRLGAEAVPAILARRDRNASRGVAPAHGLVLWEVDY